MLMAGALVFAAICAVMARGMFGGTTQQAQAIMPVVPTGPQVLTRFPAEELLVTGRTYVRGVDLLNGRVAPETRESSSEPEPTLVGAEPD